MIPALVLGVKSHHSILDMCAAPGSKTEQLLSLLHSSRNVGDTCPPTGMVVANDPDPKRIETLKRRYARCGSANLLITCSRAEDLAAHIHNRVFDRIVCDVPCTGDGTFRKFPHQWRLFRPRFGVEIHQLQLQIASAAATLLKIGGRMIYSTCSLNPLENESVVAALLQNSDGMLSLVDPAAEGLLPHLKYRPGLHSWRCDPDLIVVGESDPVERSRSLLKIPPIVPSMLPPSPSVAASLHLERCMRVVPHDQNTGGFFVAILECRAHASLETGKLSKALTKTDALHALKQLGFNPKHSDAFATATTDSLLEFQYATRAQKLHRVLAEGEAFSINCISRINGAVTQTSTVSCPHLGVLSDLGIADLTKNRLCAYYRVVKPIKSLRLAVTAVEDTMGKKRKLREDREAKEETPLDTGTYGLALLSDR
jgi:16S rRNA C967 or C1407 C5-methylase (RsmB/RsmF family)